MGATKKTTKHRKNEAHELADDAEDVKKGGAVRPDEMTPEVLEFIHALDTYKRKKQRPFPNCSEILEVLKSLGYSRTA
jgi:hypothetical protein